jgi:hypothetical protein
LNPFQSRKSDTQEYQAARNQMRRIADSHRSAMGGGEAHAH